VNALLVQAFMFLLAAVIAVPLAKRLGLGSVLGYLIAGLVIGPLLGLLGASETEDLQHFAEFGVVMMLFLVGLELEPKALWAMRARLFGLGGVQVVGSAALLGGAALVLGQSASVALAIGLVLCLSSTAIVLQTFDEKRLMKSDGGQGGFSILLMQDIAVIPMLALLPLLALPELAGEAAVQAGAHAGAGASAEAAAGAGVGVGSHGAEASEHAESFSLVAGRPGWQVALFNVGAIAAVVIGGQYLSRPLFRSVARTGLREIFSAATLLLVIGTALLMSLVGLSPALGTFLAGVLLANSEYRHELESDLEPFKGLLLGLFFITVGAGIDVALLGEQFVIIIGLTLLTLAIKAAVLWGAATLFGIRGTDRWLIALGLAQAGEFGFVLIALCLQHRVLPPAVADVLLLVVALSMLLTPLLFILFERVVLPRSLADRTAGADDADTIAAHRGRAIIAGHGRFGQVVNRILLSNGFTTTLLEHQSELIEGQRKFGTTVFYGDATRPDLLKAAGLADAALLVVAIDDIEPSLALIEYVRRERPDIHIVARAFDRRHVYRLFRSGANDIVRELFDSSVRAGRYALEALGQHPFEAERAVQLFVEHDRAGLRRLAQLWRADVPIFENEDYIDLAKEITRELERAMQGGDIEPERARPGWRPSGNTRAGPESSEDRGPRDRAGESGGEGGAEGSGDDKASSPEAQRPAAT